jgi:hypothetical protein
MSLGHFWKNVFQLAKIIFKSFIQLKVRKKRGFLKMKGQMSHLKPCQGFFFLSKAMFAPI